jgi:hypothetical protein
VELRTLDSFSLPPLSFIKIDVEGFEDHVLDGARETLRRSGFPPLLIEIQGGHNYVYADAATRRRIDGTRHKLEELGYHVIWVGSFMYLALPPSVYEIGTAIDFSTGGDADRYQTGYWSEPDQGGRWIFDDCPAGVVLRLPDYPVPQDLELAFWGRLATHAESSSRDFVLSVNGTLIEEWNLQNSSEPQSMHPRLIIPKELTAGGLLRIELKTRERLGGSEPEGVGRSQMGVQQMVLLFKSQLP